MSGIAIVFNRDGRPVEPGLLERMVAAMAHRGPDGTGQWVEGPVAMGAAMLWTTPEAVGERQPLVDEEAGLVLVMDGRVDNREELKEALLSRGLRLKSETDAELVLRAYEAWGEESAVRILGDFAYAIWDRRRRELFCARDVVGIRPFCYYLDDRTFIAGSEIRQILEDPRIALEPNEETVALYLADRLNNPEGTLYRRISRLPAAHYLVLGKGGARKHRYYDPDPRREIRYRTDAEYTEHLRELLREAVRCRMRGNGVIGISLSGGVDSSMVAATAQSLIRDGAVTDARVESFSMVFADSKCDESGVISDVVRMLNLEANMTPPFQMDLPYCTELARRYRDFPGYPNGATGDKMRALARRKGVRVLLSGHGADCWFGRSNHYVADLLWTLRMGRLAKRLREESRLPLARDRGLLWVLMVTGVLPVMPPLWRQSLKRMLGRELYPPAVNKEFARRIGLAALLRRTPERPRRMSFAQRCLYDKLVGGELVHALELVERDYSRVGIEARHPFFDRRVFEFGLALPEEQRYRDGLSKAVLRRAGAGLLPPLVHGRANRTNFSSCFVKAMALFGGEKFFESLAIAEVGWVDSKEALRLYRKKVDAYYGRVRDRSRGGVLSRWPIFALEIWFRETFLAREPMTGSHERDAEHNGDLISPSSRRAGGLAVARPVGR